MSSQMVFYKLTKPTLKWLLSCYLLIASFLAPSFAQSLPEQPEYLVKSAMIFKMLQYTTWPDENKLSAIRLAFVGEEKQLYDEMLRAAKSITIKGLPLIVFKTDIQSIAPHVNQVIYLDQQYSANLHAIANKARRTDTLLLSNQSNDRHELMINFLPSEQGVLSFEVNPSNIVFEGLKIDPDLLLLGGTEIDVAELFRKTELALQQVKLELFEREQKLKQTNGILAKEQDEVSRQKALNKIYQDELNNRELMLKQRADELGLLNDDITRVSEALTRKQEELAEREQRYNQQLNRLQDQMVKVSLLNQQIVENQAVLAEQQKKLESLAGQNDAQQGAIISQKKALLLVTGALFLFTLLIIYSLWVSASRKRANQRLKAFQANMVSLGGVGRDLTTNLDLEKVIDKLYSSLNQILDAHVVLLGILDTEKQCVDVPLVMEQQQKVPPIRFNLDDDSRPAVICVKEGREVLINDVQQWHQETGCQRQQPSFGSQMNTVIYLPLIIGEKIVGCVSIQSPEKNAYSEQQLEMMRVLSRYIAIAVSNALGYAQLQQQKLKTQSQNAQVLAAQQQLSQAQKMAQVGKKATQIVGDLNDPLNYTHTASCLMAEEIKKIKAFLVELAGGDDADKALLQAFEDNFATLQELTQTAQNGSSKLKRVIDKIQACTENGEDVATTTQLRN